MTPALDTKSDPTVHPETDPAVTTPMPARVDAAELRDWLTRPDRPRTYSACDRYRRTPRQLADSE